VPTSSPSSPPRRVAVTRPPEEDPGEDRLARLLRGWGLEPISFPLLRLSPPPAPGGLTRVAKRIARACQTGAPPPYGWILITSRNVLPPLVAALRAAGVSPPDLQPGGVRVAAVGRPTADALRQEGIDPDLVPMRYTAEDLLAALEGAGAFDAPARFLLPRAEVARDVLPKGIRARGGRVEVITAYRVEEDPEAARDLCRAVAAGELGGVTLTSGRAARLLGRMWKDGGGGPWPAAVAVGVIGPVTAREARGAGLPVDRVPPESTLEALAAAMAHTTGDVE
jgi:uroporphyrinogen-III synthase